MSSEQQHSSTGKSLQCVIVTPERAMLDEPADFVALPMYDGELGVAPGRRPLIGRLGIGELRVRRGAETKHFFVDSGFAQVRDNVVTVLTPSALTAAEIKPDAVRENLHELHNASARTLEEVEAKSKAQQRARIKLKLASEGRPGFEAH
jgi:F-type H+-transporting ATPase subunit epsilon